MSHAALPPWCCAGSGKTSVLQELGRSLGSHPPTQAHVLHVACKALAGGEAGRALGVLGAVASEALACCPGLVLLEDLDLLCPAGTAGPEQVGGTAGPEQMGGTAGPEQVGGCTAGSRTRSGLAGLVVGSVGLPASLAGCCWV